MSIDETSLTITPFGSSLDKAPAIHVVLSQVYHVPVYSKQHGRLEECLYMYYYY